MEALNRSAVQASGVPISWTLYFPSEEFSPEDRRAELIKSLIDGFLTEKGQHLLQQADPKELFLNSRWTVSMEALKQHLCSTHEAASGRNELGAAAELLLQALEAAPEEALSCLGAAATEMFLERGLIETPALPSVAAQHASSRLAVRLVDHTDSIIEFKKLKASSLDRLVTVCGTVVRVGPLRPLVVAMDFTCTRCGAVTSLSFPDGRFTQPAACGHDNCRNRTFLQNRAGARKINFQTIRLQELTGGTGGGEDMGRMPRVVDCELREDLADACLPGDVVAVCGIVKIINNETDVGGGERAPQESQSLTHTRTCSSPPSPAGRSKKREQCLFQLYIDAISVVNANAHSTASALRSPPSAGGASGGAVEMGEEDLRSMLEYVGEHEGEGDLFQHIVHSFCPSIYGHVLVKGELTCVYVVEHEGEGDLFQHIVHSFCPSIYGHVLVKGAVELGEDDMRSMLEYVGEHEGEGDLFQHIVHSFCPSIYGHVLVKAGIILSLFGGVRKHEGEANRVPVRGDVHALLVGDPGMGKSQLLKAAAAVAPRGVYVCGSGASSVGLTVAVVKDGPGGEYAFEAGAMVMADQGTCCIDEFDKMGNEQQALLEAMEQQSVSVAKAGLLANFSARTAVLAAANPVGGHYNRARTLNENLKLSAALLSRFDLIFILLDRPDHHTDQRLSEHVLQMHAGMPSRSKASKRSSHLFLTAPSATDGHASHLDLPLSHRLRLRSSAARNFSPLPPARLRQYIAYARTHVHPRLSEEARAVIKAFYLRLREHSRAMDGPPITARQLESLVRLAEARARVELREEVTEADAQEAVELMGECLLDKLTDEAGNIDAGRGGGSSKSKESKRFLAALQRTAKQAIKTCFSRKELAQLADDMCLRVPDLDALIDSLNEAGFLLKKGGGLFQVRPAPIPPVDPKVSSESVG
ncbi:unnamed protein product [Closterium sp. Naga37s-1]|nr:unnamed protein product [Closterium sp. Naga37s-1]